MRLPGLHLETAERSTVTPYGGLALASAFLKRFRVGQKIDQRVHVLKIHLPYHESDHVLAQALNLYVGGEGLEDQAALQNDEGVLRMLGACRIPDPTTAGDFLRRFDEKIHPGSLAGLRAAVDEVQDEVWGKLAGKRKRKRDWAVIDLDGHTKELCGLQKEGADFDHRGRWSYNVLLASLAGTGECLAVRNRPGNLRSSNGAAALLEEILPRAQKRFGQVLVRADSDFDRRDIRYACEQAGVHFAFVAREATNRLSWAESIPESAWKPFRTRAHREQVSHRQQQGFKPRRKKRNRRRRRARERGYTALQLNRQWVAEIPWTPPGSDQTYRMVIRRQLIEESEGQEHLFDFYRYRYVVTDLPRSSWSAAEVIDTTYQRCDQENVIEQMGSGVAMWRMPVAEFDGNCAWLEIGRLAWNLGKWIAQLALPAEVVRWEWKRYRQAFVYVATEVIHRSRQRWCRFSPAHRFLNLLVNADGQLQS
jgi:hypothetical protein